VRAGEQVFNNYGPKSNEELLLGYGFTLSPNPDDVVALKLGARPSPLAVDDNDGKIQQGSSGVRHYVRRDGAIPQGLLDEMRALLLASSDNTTLDEGEEEASREDAEYWERELELADQLGAMLALKLQALETSELSMTEYGGGDRGSKRPRYTGDGDSQGGDDRPDTTDGIRPGVMRLVRDYRQGT
jgi:hypothetical protein